jgi:hypothetical protein
MERPPRFFSLPPVLPVLKKPPALSLPAEPKLRHVMTSPTRQWRNDGPPRSWAIRKRPRAVEAAGTGEPRRKPRAIEGSLAHTEGSGLHDVLTRATVGSRAAATTKAGNMQNSIRFMLPVQGLVEVTRPLRQVDELPAGSRPRHIGPSSQRRLDAISGQVACPGLALPHPRPRIYHVGRLGT